MSMKLPLCYRKDVVKLAMVQHIHLVEKGCSLCILVSVSISIPIHANIHKFILAHDSHVQLNDPTQHRMNRTNGCCSLRCVHKLLNKYNLSFSQMVQNFWVLSLKVNTEVGEGGSGVHHTRRWMCLEPICVGTNILLQSVMLEGRWFSFPIDFMGKVVLNAELKSTNNTQQSARCYFQCVWKWRAGEMAVNLSPLKAS